VNYVAPSVYTVQLFDCQTHTPEIFAQFSQLGLSPPMTLTEVDASLQQLSAMQVRSDVCVRSLRLYFSSMLACLCGISKRNIPMPAAGCC